MIQVNWIGELLRVRTATGGQEAGSGKEAGGDGSAGDSGKKGEPAKEGSGAGEDAEEALPVLRGLEIARHIRKPVLVYFHWPHEDGRRGKEIQKFCNGPLDEEAFARISHLFHCVEVNTRDSDLRLVEEAKVRLTPSLMVCRTDGTILWRTEDTRMSGRTLGAALLRVVEESFPARWKEIQAERESQKKALREARAALAAGKTEDAAFSLRDILGSEVRYTDEWMTVRKLLVDVEKKLAEEQEKK